jgi:oleandomycin transport system permease protein
MSVLTAPPVTEAPNRPTRNPTPARPMALVRHSLALAQRSIIKIKRTPEQLMDVTLQPIIFVLLFVYIFGGAVAGSTHDYLQFVLPAIMVQTVVFSSVSIGVNLNTDVDKGVFDRFRSLPIPRSAPLVGAVLGEVVRYAISVAVLMGFGSLLGFRVATDPLSALAACLLVILFALCMCWISVYLGMIFRQPSAVQGAGFLLMFPLTFGSNMFVQASSMPGWLQEWVKINPITHLVDAVRDLMLGGAVAVPVLEALAWGVGIVAVFAPLAVRAYRRKA